MMLKRYEIQQQEVMQLTPHSFVVRRKQREQHKPLRKKGVKYMQWIRETGTEGSD